MLKMFLLLLLLIITLSDASKIVPYVKLSSGYKIPMVGFGTWQSQNVEKSVTAALDIGYKHIDTAFTYDNEKEIGESLKKWFAKGQKREELFITSKLPPLGNSASEVEKYLNASLERLGLEYLDMYLIHIPVGFKKDGDSYGPSLDKYGNLIFDYDTDHISIWKAMEEQVRMGRVRSIGLSNFNKSQIENVIQHAEIKPSNLQIELHVYMQQKELRKFCKDNSISLTSYSTLGSPGSNSIWTTEKSRSMIKPLNNPTILKIANNHRKSPAQVLLRFAVQNDIIVIPKSSRPDKIKENIELFDFELTQDEMNEIEKLDKGECGRIINFQGPFKGIERHPLYPFSGQL